MILLDTNVLSEFMRSAPAQSVVSWLDAQNPAHIWVCSISRAEIELGINLLPDGQRKRGLKQAAEAMFTDDFAGRCLVFDDQAAICYGAIVAQRMGIGRPISVEDAQIAAIATVNNLALATRNERDFELIERLAVVNPWLPLR